MTGDGTSKDSSKKRLTTAILRRPILKARPNEPFWPFSGRKETQNFQGYQLDG